MKGQGWGVERKGERRWDTEGEGEGGLGMLEGRGVMGKLKEREGEEI